MNDSDIKSQISAAAVTLKRGLRHMIYMSIDETFTVYVVKLQNLIMMMSIASTVKMMKLKL
jgi:hypothetical protein